MTRPAFLAQIRNPALPAAIGGAAGADAYKQGGTALGLLISNVVGGLFIAGFLLSFVFFIMGGFTWITAGGDKTKLEKARDELTNAIIGLIVVAAAFALSSLVANFFGLQFTSLTLPAIQPGN